MKIPLLSKFFGNQGNVTGGQSFFNTMFSDGETFTQYALLKEYKHIVYTCIHAISDDVAQYEPIIYKNDKPLATHEFLRVLDYPNPDLSKYELFEATQSFLELTGDAFWYIGLGERTGKPKTIDLIRPDRVDVAVGADGIVAGYTVRRDDGTQIPLEKNEVIHFKTFNPLNSYRGLGTVQAQILYIEGDKGLSKFQANFLKNQAMPSGVLTLNGKITKEAFDKIKKQWKENYSGTSNAGKTLIIRETEASFEKMGLSLADLDVSQLKALSKEDILQAFRVPEAILGKTDSNGLGRANVEAIEYIFAKRTIEPKLTRIDDVLRRAILLYYKDNILVGHKSQIPEDKQEELAYYDKAFNRWLTADEIREEEGYPPMPKVETPVEATKIYLKKKAKKTLNEQLMAIEDKQDKDYIKGLKKLLKGQKDEVLGHISTMSQKQSVRYLSDGFEMEFSKEEVELNILESLIQAIINSGQITLNELGKPDEKFVLTQAIRDSVFDMTNSALKNFNETTALQIRQQLIQGLQENEGVEQLTTRIESVYSDATGYRAKRIARTESHRFINQGNALAYQQEGYGYVRWVANGDACPFCQALDGKVVKIGTPFIPLNGSLKTDEGELINDYGDIMYADAHPNCSCRLEPATKPYTRAVEIKEADNELIKQEMEELQKMKDDLTKSIKEIAEKTSKEQMDILYSDLLKEIKNV